MTNSFLKCETGGIINEEKTQVGTSPEYLIWIYVKIEELY